MNVTLATATAIATVTTKSVNLHVGSTLEVSGGLAPDEWGNSYLEWGEVAAAANCSWVWTDDAAPVLCANATVALGNTTTTTNVTAGAPLPAAVLATALISIVLAVMILATVIGNAIVIAAIILERNLQNVANYLVVSLAVADLLVACLVMPLGAVYEISQGWILGPELCDMWTFSDVLCCTASILHLVAIATDRYWAVTNVDYIHTRNGRRITYMIVLVWVVALGVSLAPQLGWRDPDYLDRITLQRRCLVSQDVAYQIFATCSTFYVPLFVILVLYWKIFQTARKRIRRRREVPTPARIAAVDGAPISHAPLSARDRRFVKKRFLNLNKYRGQEKARASTLLLTEGQSTTTVNTVDEDGSSRERTTAFTVSERVESGAGFGTSPEKSSTPTSQPDNGCAATSTASARSISAVRTAAAHPTQREKKETLEAKRERKAAKTLAIITGAFVFCWLPFFIMALVMPICEHCVIDDYVASFFLWLGYFNSTLNPIIYTIFSPDFRRAFARILFGGHRRRRAKKY